jgi:Sigma-54 interaction domain
MSTLSKVYTAARRTAPVADHGPGGSERGSTDQALELVQLAEQHRVNVLLLGTNDVVNRVMAALHERLPEPVARWSPGDEFMLPAVGKVGAIVLNDVGALAIQEQIQLLEWLNAAQGRTQVVSTAPTLLLPRVKAGAFIDTLYYRLNTLCLDGTTS